MSTALYLLEKLHSLPFDFLVCMHLAGPPDVYQRQERTTIALLQFHSSALVSSVDKTDEIRRNHGFLSFRGRRRKTAAVPDGGGGGGAIWGGTSVRATRACLASVTHWRTRAITASSTEMTQIPCSSSPTVRPSSIAPPACHATRASPWKLATWLPT
jgi:hypothetical protein